MIRTLVALGVLSMVAVGILGCHGNDEPDAAASASISPTAAHLRGDLDDDGIPSVADAIGILRIVVGLDADDPAADADADGSTGVGDAIAVLRCLVGLADWPLGEWRPPSTRTISGTIAEDDFVVGAADRVECQGDVIIQCQTATIAGELYALNATGYGADGAGIRIEADGDIVVTGEIAAGDGAIGDADGNGGNGGDVTLVSANGNVTVGSAVGGTDVRTAQGAINTVAAGNAGDGGDGLLGGAGGEGGTLTLDARSGTVTIHQATGLLAAGNGGEGGDGVVGEDDMDGFSIPGQIPSHGGDGGGLVVHCNGLDGVEASDTGMTHEGTPIFTAVLDDGVATGGDGGDAGEFWFAVDPNTGEPIEAEMVLWSAGVATQDVETIVGSHGGNGTHQAGDGGWVEIFGLFHVHDVGDADDLHVTGGDGGMAGVVTHGSEGVMVLDLAENLVFRAGHGGDVAVWGYSGRSGAPLCAAGGTGGAATAIGGPGGDIMEVAIPTPHEPTYVPGNGGEAFARGGRGGWAGDCCRPTPAAGQKGGDGGAATATGGDGGSVVGGSGAYSERGTGGDAGARGGDGVDGGMGTPPGGGGKGGTASISPGDGNPKGMPAGEVAGNDGGTGEECPGLDEPWPDQVKGRLTDKDGNPVAGWGVKNNFLGLGGRSVGDEVRTQFDGIPTNSDATGRYVYNNVAAGEYQVYPADAPAGLYWVPPFRFYTKQDGVGVGGQDFQQRVAAQVDITIPTLDQNGNPVEGATVDMWLQSGLRYSAWTCGLGLAKFTGIWSGYYQAEVKEPDAPPGYEWDPARRDVAVGTEDETLSPFRLKPSF